MISASLVSEKTMKKARGHFRGSVLVFSLLVLAMLLSAALSGAAIIILGKNSSRTTEKSVVSFQVADGAVENVLKRVYKDTDSTLDQLANHLFGSASCSNGVISGTLPSGSGTYQVALFDNSGDKLHCSGSGYSSYAEWRPKLSRIVSTGTYAGVTRAIDVSVKP